MLLGIQQEAWVMGYRLAGYLPTSDQNCDDVQSPQHTVLSPQSGASEARFSYLLRSFTMSGYPPYTGRRPVASVQHVEVWRSCRSWQVVTTGHMAPRWHYHCSPSPHCLISCASLAECGEWGHARDNLSGDSNLSNPHTGQNMGKIVQKLLKFISSDRNTSF